MRQSQGKGCPNSGLSGGAPDGGPQVEDDDELSRTVVFPTQEEAERVKLVAQGVIGAVTSMVGGALEAPWNAVPAPWWPSPEETPPSLFFAAPLTPLSGPEARCTTPF